MVDISSICFIYSFVSTVDIVLLMQCIDSAFLDSGISQSYSTHRENSMLKLTKLAVNNRRFDGRIDSPVAVANQVSSHFGSSLQY